MARSSSAPAQKEPGRLKQMWQVFQMTRRYDSLAVWYIVGVFVAPIALAVVLALVLGGGWLNITLFVIAGILAGILLAMLVLGRRAERAAYKQIEGQPGASGAVLRSGLRRNWIGAEMPVAVNAKTQDAVFRAVGKGGIVLVVEGPETRTKKLVDDERRKVARIVPNVPITVIRVGAGEGEVALHRISPTLNKLPKALTKPEISAVNNRLASLQGSLPIPKGIDPNKVRAQRGKLR
ncbi:DUF4191 domain-containing protein [Agromyces seonyuensis]|uniref:DUF4191 family protein n=1 Tax=Agromyces seonyuensis TaxID=2662446 RepID=A0A6I4NRJ7_9MICO|nr:DUF4191 domain-containing protein [Agromyces seonyuensis]MWB97088.1 DUF4191 family protein [Agromyces seonyuensis]